MSAAAMTDPDIILRRLARAVERLPYDKRVCASAPLGRAEAAAQWLDEDPHDTAARATFERAVEQVEEWVPMTGDS